MTLARRVEKLESALSPRTATLRWLAEAHAAGSLSAYLDRLLDQPGSASPFHRVPAAAAAAATAAAATAANRGQPRESVAEAVRAAVRDALFLVHLALEINALFEETIDLERVRRVALSNQTEVICLAQELASFDPAAGGADYSERWADSLAQARAWLSELYVMQEARTLLERRYLEGKPCLFPELASEWAALLEDAESLVGLLHKVSLDEPAGDRRTTRRTRPGSLDLEALRACALELAEAAAARLVDTARADALYGLGDREGAMAIARRALRAR
jgi:hypothetical protein